MLVRRRPAVSACAILACLALGRAQSGCGSEDGSLEGPSTSGDGGNGNGDGDGAPPGNVDAAADAPLDAGAADGAPPGANPIISENARPGTTDWILANAAAAREIEGYASATSVAPGGTIRIFVNTASPRYAIEIFRLGWYGGSGGRLVAANVERDGHAQVVPSPDADGLVECAWADPYDVVVPPSWVTGVYVAKLTAKSSGKQSYVPFVVRDDARAATYLFQSSVTTHQAYNNWGGRSLYDFNSSGGVRASRVSFLRPYALGLNPQSAAGVGAGELITNLQGVLQTGPVGWEYPMVRFLEREGYDVAYATNLDVHRDPALVAKHRVFLSVGHDEYWSSRMRDHVEHARDHGTTSLAFFSGNVSYWQVRFGPSKGGAPDATMTCFKDQATDPLSATADAHETTVRFGSVLLARGEEGLGGLAFQDFGMNADLVVDDATSWVLAGTGLTAGTKIPGLLGYEVDGLTSPPLAGVQGVMRSPWTTSQPSSGASDSATRLLPSGAETFASGTIQFSWGLDAYRPPGVTQPNVASPAAETIARNVLGRFAQPRPPRTRSPVLVAEPFSAPTDPERWSRRTITEGAAAFDAAVGVGVSAGRLTITPRSGITGLHHGGIVSRTTLPLTCAAASVEVVEVASTASAADTTFALAVSESRWYRMTVESGTLVLAVRDGAAPTSQATMPYDATAHRWFRIRHDCVTNRIRFETSPDGSTWSTRRDVAPTIDLHAAYVELEAGTYQSETAPGQAVFDNLDVRISGVASDFGTQRDPELFTPDALHEGGYDPDVRAFTFGGRLHLRPRANVPGIHHMGYATTRAIDWEGGVASIVVEQTPSPTSAASVSLAIVSDSADWARATISAGKLFLQLHASNATTSTELPHDATAHRHLRIRHDRASDELVWDTSADGSNWTERRRSVRPFAVSTMRAEIESGTYKSETSPGEAIVDDFRFAR